MTKYEGTGADSEGLEASRKAEKRDNEQAREEATMAARLSKWERRNVKIEEEESSPSF